MVEIEKPKDIATSPLLRITIAGVFIVLAACAILFAAREHVKRNLITDPTQSETLDKPQDDDLE